MDQYARGYVGSQIARELVSMTDEIMDATKTGGIDGYDEGCATVLSFNWRFRLSMAIQRKLGIAGPVGSRLANRMERLRTCGAVLSQVRSSGVDDIRALVGDSAANSLCEILDQRIARTMSALSALRAQYPDYARELQERYLFQVALRKERSDYSRLHDEAVIGTEIYANLQTELEARGEAELGKRPKLDIGLDAETPCRARAALRGFEQRPHQGDHVVAENATGHPRRDHLRQG